MNNPAEVSKTNPNEFRITQLLSESQLASGNRVCQLSATQDSNSMIVPLTSQCPAGTLGVHLHLSHARQRAGAWELR